jgi:hypothetical protein
MRPITFSLQFRGVADEHDGGLRKYARAPGCALVTSLIDGLAGHYVWSENESEAVFESTLAFVDETSFRESATIRLPRGEGLRLDGRGVLAASPDPQLRHGIVVWEIVGGDGRLAGTCGRVTSNFLLSETGDLTETQLGVMFTNGAPSPRGPD